METRTGPEPQPEPDPHFDDEPPPEPVQGPELDTAPPARSGAGRRNWLLLGGIGCALVLAVCLIVGAVAWVVTSSRVDDILTDLEQIDVEQDTAPTPEQETDSASSETPSSSAGDDATAGDETPEPDPTPFPEPSPPTPEIEPESSHIGSARANPVPLGEEGQTEDGAWRGQVNEVIRGDEAWQRILETNQFNVPPDDGMEYVMLNVTIAYHGDEPDSQIVSAWDFRSTGDARVKWFRPGLVNPEPELSGQLFSGGEATGWVVVQARIGEGNTMAIFQRPDLWGEEGEMFLALEPGAVVPAQLQRSAEPTSTGVDRANPAPIGERAVTETWEVWVMEAYRGEEAWQRVEQANAVNTPPEEGYEYVVIRLGARNVRAGHGTDFVSYLMVESTGSSNVIHPRPVLVPISPELNSEVYAGGEANGWVVLNVQAGETEPQLVFYGSWMADDARYLALE